MCTGGWAQSTPSPSAPTVDATTPAAPAADGKRALAARMVALQKPDVERMANQLTGSAVEPTIVRWQPVMQSVPEAKRAQVGPKLDAELKAYADGVKKLVEGQLNKSADTALLNAYLNQFSEDELRQLVAQMESPVFKKYQSLAPELGNTWVKDAVENSRASVTAREKTFDTKASALLGVPAPKRADAATHRK